MQCSICKDTNIFLIFTPHYVYCECTNGHGRREAYQDQGGSHPRPDNPVRSLEDLFSAEEATLYKLLIEEISSDIEFYQNADPTEKAARLSAISQVESQEIYTLFKKITMYQNIMKGG